MHCSYPWSYAALSYTCTHTHPDEHETSSREHGVFSRQLRILLTMLAAQWYAMQYPAKRNGPTAAGCRQGTYVISLCSAQMQTRREISQVFWIGQDMAWQRHDIADKTAMPSYLLVFCFVVVTSVHKSGRLLHPIWSSTVVRRPSTKESSIP